jgi:DNA repair exonuclease SbcCD ATPase subunit
MFGGAAMIPWALANWGKLLALILAALLIGYIAVLNVKIANRDKKIAEITQEVEGWKSAYSILSNKVVEQNAAIQKLDAQRKTALKKRARADKKAAPIVAHQKEVETRLEAIAPVSEASRGECEAELSKIRQLLDTSR